MALTVTVVPFQLSSTETVTNAKLNQGFNPTITVVGATTGLSNWSATPPSNGQVPVWDSLLSQYVPGTPSEVPATTGNYLYLSSHYQ